jgi:hypothetical protein
VKKRVVVGLQVAFNPMNSYRTKNTLEIFSGSLLAKRKEWQQVKNQLPAHTCLLVAPLGNAAPTRKMLNLGRCLRQEGISVFVLSVG